MKKILPIMLSLLFLLCACGKTEEVPQPTEPEAAVIQTSPAETEATEPEATEDPAQEAEGETQTPSKTDAVYRLVRLTVLDDAGSESWHQEYSYDDYGREKQTVQYMDGVITYSASTAYTSATEYETTIERGDTKYSIGYTCDEAGRVIRQETIQDGTVTESSAYTYDDHGNQLTAQMVYGEDEMNFSYEYTYDGNGNQLTRKEYQDGEQVGYLEMTYDEKGRESASVYYFPDGSVNYSTKSTWEGSTETRISYDSEGNAYMTLVTTYDETGNILSQETWQEGVLVSSTEYTYELIEIIAE